MRAPQGRPLLFWIVLSGLPLWMRVSVRCVIAAIDDRACRYIIILRRVFQTGEETGGRWRYCASTISPSGSPVTGFSRMRNLTRSLTRSVGIGSFKGRWIALLACL